MARRPSVLPGLLAAGAVSGMIAVLLGATLGRHPAPLHLDLAHHPLLSRLVGSAHLDLQHPGFLWLAVVVPYFALVATRSLADLPRPQLLLAVSVRAVLALSLVAALARPASMATSARVCNVFLVDVSDSVPDEALEDFRSTVEAAVRARGEHEVRVVTFARRPRIATIPARLQPGARLAAFARHDAGPGSTGVARSGAGTDLAAALSLSYGLFPPDHLRRVVVLSDGVQTDGDALTEAARAARFDVRISVVPSRRGAPPEVAVRDLRLPERIRVNEPFEVRATMFASRPGRAALRLQQGEVLNGLDGQRTVDLAAGDNEVRFRSVVRVPGDVTYSLAAQPQGPDRFPDNNHFVTTATVPGPPAVLYVEGDPAHGRYFREALAGAGFEVESRTAREFPASVREMERFDFIVLSDVPAESIPLGAQQALARYVRDLGGGFLMAGGARSFGLGGWQGTEVERLLPVRMESERRRDQPSLALALVIDRSGSMQGAPLTLAVQAALATLNALGPDDLIEVIVFDSEPERLVRMQSARNRLRIENDLRRLRPGGGTAIFPALDAAAQDLAITRAVTRHVILLTDGNGQPDEVAHDRDVVQAMVADGVTVSTVGLGSQVDRTLLENIGRTWGGGRAYFTADASNLPQIFLREATLAARSAAVEEPVQPHVVAPAGFLRELTAASIPYLYGYVSTRARGEPAQVLLESDTNPPEPLLARWRVGLGWSLAWTSDLKNRWAVEWIHWPRWSAFWSQLTREHMRPRRRQELGLRAEIIAGQVHVAVDAIGADDRFEDGLVSELIVRGPQPGGREERRALPQVGPGRYEASFPLDRYGAFALHAVHRREQAVVAESFGRVSNPYPAEYAALEPDTALLSTLARATGGDTDPGPALMFAARGGSITHARPLWKVPVLVAIALLLVDLLLRRVRLFDRAFRARSRAAA